MRETHGKRRMTQKVLLGVVLVAIGVLVIQLLLQREGWNVPEAAKSAKNPLVSSEETLRVGAAAYREKCMQCHGEKGHGDGPEAFMNKPAPADLAAGGRMSAMSDGEIFYKISEGRRPMPSFKSRLTEEQRWQLVLYLRWLAAQAESRGGK